MDRTLTVLTLFAAGAASVSGVDSPQRRASALEAFVEGTGPPLVMLGGGTLGAAEFAPHAHVLGARFRVVRLQTLNITAAERREPLAPGYSVRLESEAMARSLDHLGLSAPLDVVGHSFGALVALDFALEHPGRIHTLTLAEPPAFWVVPARERQASGDLRTMDELTRTLGPATEPSDDQFTRFQCALGRCDVKAPAPGDPAWADWTWRRSALRGLSVVSTHTDDVHRLRRFRRPVLILTGSNTVPFHRRINDILAGDLPQAERAELPGGHGAPSTAADEFVKTIETFIGRHSRA